VLVAAKKKRIFALKDSSYVSKQLCNQPVEIKCRLVLSEYNEDLIFFFAKCIRF